MSEFKKLTDEELQSVTGGIEWKSYGQCILDNGGKRIPKLMPLVEAIIAKDYSEVARLSYDAAIKDIPIVKQCLIDN